MEDNTSPLTGEQISMPDAVEGLLSVPDEAPETEPAEVVETPDEAPDELAAETPSDETTEEPEEFTDDEDEPELPAIDPPTSWKQLDKDRFSELPRDMQEVISDRERSRETATNRALQEASDTRKTADAEREQAASERQLYQQQLEHVLPAVQASMERDFPDIRTPVDVQRLAQEDPERYIQWDARQKALQMAHDEHSRLGQQQQAEVQTAQRDYLAKAEERLVEVFPEWKDMERGRREIAEIHRFLVEEHNVPKEALPGMVEAHSYKIAQESMLYRKAQRAKAKAVSKTVPKVQKPGTTRGKNAADDRTARLQRLGKSGDIEDALGLLVK